MNRAKFKQSAAASHRGENAATASSSICSSGTSERENEPLRNAEALFVDGPPVGLQRRFSLVRLSGDNTLVRAAIAVAIGWLPLSLLPFIPIVLMIVLFELLMQRLAQLFVALLGGHAMTPAAKASR